MGVRKRVSALLLAVLLSFGVCAVDYLKVDALEVGGSVVWDTAINYLLGLLGLSPITENGDKIVDFDSMRSKWVQDYEAYFYANVQPEDLPEGYTKERAYQNWIDNVCRGNLNTVEYGAWDIFKEWAETLPSRNNTTVGSPSDIVLGSTSVYDAYNIIANYYGIPSYGWRDGVLGSEYLTTSFKACRVVQYDGYLSCRFFLQTDNISISTAFSGKTLVQSPSGFPCVVMEIYDTVSGGGAYSDNLLDSSKSYLTAHYYASGQNGFNWLDSVNGKVVNVFYLGVSGIPLSNQYYNVETMGGSVVVPESEYAKVNDRVSDLQIINDYSTTTTQNIVSIDWDRIASMISDATGTITGSLDKTITDALDDSQEKVAAGTMTVANYNDYVTEISNTYVYDITNETSITNPDSTVTGVVSGNVENAEFVLNGLQYVFPFCIPWDIKDFVTLLVADPVAPVIEYPIYNPVTDTDEIITIDFSLWENQVRIIRYIFDFLLIIGLLLLARSLIGAGGSD